MKKRNLKKPDYHLIILNKKMTRLGEGQAAAREVCYGTGN
jgi:hypothetical protein